MMHSIYHINQDLYDLVWAEPVIKAAQRYGITSDWWAANSEPVSLMSPIRHPPIECQWECSEPTSESLLAARAVSVRFEHEHRA
jgi:hypothetical protein